MGKTPDHPEDEKIAFQPETPAGDRAGKSDKGALHSMKELARSFHQRVFGTVEKTPRQLEAERVRNAVREKLEALWKKADDTRGSVLILEGVDPVEFAYMWYVRFFDRMEDKFPDDLDFWENFLAHLHDCERYKGQSIFKDSSLMQHMLEVPGKKRELFLAYGKVFLQYGSSVCDIVMNLSGIHKDNHHDVYRVAELVSDFSSINPRASFREYEDYVEIKIKKNSIYR